MIVLNQGHNCQAKLLYLLDQKPRLLITRFCAASIQERLLIKWHLLNSTFLWDRRQRNALPQEGGVAAKAREVIRGDTASLATATDSMI